MPYASLSHNQLTRFHRRVYALTFRNKFVALYFGSLAATKFATFFISSLSNPVGLFDLPKIPIPLDTFNACLVIPKFRIKLVPNSLATAFGEEPYLL